MTLKFYGSPERLRTIVKRCGIEGVWRYIEDNDQHQFKAATGEHMNWWPQTGTIYFQGGSTKILQERIVRALVANAKAEQGEYQKPALKQKSEAKSRAKVALPKRYITYI